MKKRYFVIPAAAALLYCLYTSESELPGEFEKVKVYRCAKSFIADLNSREYPACYSCFTPAMQGSMSSEKLAATLDAVLNSLGDFIRFKGFSVSPKKILGDDYAVCTVKCVYENGPATFTLSLNRDMKVGGLYIK